MNLASLKVKYVSLPAGATGLSEIFTLDGVFAIVGFIIPASWVTADITFQASMDPPNDYPSGHALETVPTNFYPVYDDTGNPVVISIGNISSTARMVCTNQAVYVTGTHFKLKSVVVGTPGTAVNQTGAPSIGVICKLG
jgi:hypothetical protein